MATSRILPTSGNPYGSGGVIFDSTPYTQYHLQQLAREKAKDEALDNYFRNLDTKITTAGVRTQDVPDLIRQQNADREFYLKNKEAIKNPSKDNGEAYNEYMQRYNSKLSYINQSKNESDKYKQIVPIFADPTKRALMTDDVIGKLELHDLPLTDPKRKSFDVMSINYNPKPFDEIVYGKGLPITKTKSNITFENSPDYQKSFLRTPITNYTPNYDKLTLATIGENKYASDPSYRALVNNLAKNEYQFKRLNTIYKNNFGQDLDITHPEQVAAAHTLSLIPKYESERGKPEIDQVAYQAAKYKQAEADRRDRQRISISHADARAGLGTDNIGDYEQNSRTGTLFKRSPETPSAADVEIIRFPETVTKELSDVIGGEIENVGRMPDGRYFDIKLRKDDTIDWLKSKEIPYLQIRSAIANKALPSTFKVKQVTGKPEKTETKRFVFPSGKTKF